MLNRTRTRRSARIGLYASLAVCSWVPRAQAQPRNGALELQYDAPSECPTRSAVEAAALRLAGQVRRAPIVASVFVERDGQIYRAHVRTQAGARQRVLEDASCTAVAEAVEVLLALAIDPDAPIGGVTTTSNQGPSGVTSGPPAPISHDGTRPQPAANGTWAPSTDSHPQATSIQAEADREPSVFFSPQFGMEAGALPHVSEFGGVNLALPIAPRWRLTESGRMWRHSSQTIPATAAGGVFSLWTVSSGACVLTTQAVPSTSACIGLEAGRLSGTSYGVRNKGSGGALWLTPTAAFEASVPANKLVSFVIAAELGVPLVRRAFYLQEVGTAQSSQVHKSSALSARLSFGLSLAF